MRAARDRAAGLSFHAGHGAAVHALGDTQLRVHLRRLEELEYLIVRHGGPGQTFVYQVNFEMDAEGRPVLAGLSQFYSYDKNCAGVNGDYAGVRGPVAGDCGGARVRNRQQRREGTAILGEISKTAV